MRFDQDPATPERQRKNWQIMSKRGPGDGSSIILNADGTISAASSDFRNLLYNGAFDVWQRYPAGRTLGTTLNFVADRWRLNWVWAAGLNMSVAPDALVPSTMSNQSCKITVNSAARAPAAGDYCEMTQVLEGNVFRRAVGKKVTASFWVWSDVPGTFSVTLRNVPVAYSCVQEVVLLGGQWEYKTVTFPQPPAAAAWLYDSSATAALTFCLSANTAGAFATAPGAWTAGNKFASTGQANFMGTAAGSRFWLGEVQLEVGEAATEYNHRPVSTELLLCQRYFSKSYDQSTGLAGVTGGVGIGAQGSGAGAGLLYYATQRFPVTMRSAPTVLLYNPATGAANIWRNLSLGADSGAATLTLANDTSITVRGIQVAADAAGHLMGLQWAADAEL